MRTLAALTFFGVLSLPSIASAQTATTGTIEGIVSDPNGAIIPAVRVTATSPNLISAQSVVTNIDGWYRILNLPPGRYVITTEASSGFNKSSSPNVDVSLSKTTVVPIKLEPMGATATVTV